MKNLIFNCVAAVAVVCLVVPAGAQESDRRGGYLGANIGTFSEKDTCDTLQADASVVSASCDDLASVLRVHAGWRRDENFAFEGGIFATTESEYNIVQTVSGGSVTYNLLTSYAGIDFALLGTIPVTERFSVSARGGATFWAVEGRTAFIDVSDEGTELLYGVGASYAVTSDSDLTVEFTRIAGENVQADLWMAGFSIRL